MKTALDMNEKCLLEDVIFSCRNNRDRFLTMRDARLYELHLVGVSYGTMVDSGHARSVRAARECVKRFQDETASSRRVVLHS